MQCDCMPRLHALAAVGHSRSQHKQKPRYHGHRVVAYRLFTHNFQIALNSCTNVTPLFPGIHSYQNLTPNTNTNPNPKPNLIPVPIPNHDNNINQKFYSFTQNTSTPCECLYIICIHFTHNHYYRWQKMFYTTKAYWISDKIAEWQFTALIQKKRKCQIIRIGFEPTNSKTWVSGLNHWATDSIDYHLLQHLYNTVCYVTSPLRPITSDCRLPGQKTLPKFNSYSIQWTNPNRRCIGPRLK